MSDPTPCAQFEEGASELALGNVPEPQRSALLAHVDGCADCRRLLDDLSLTADRTLLAVGDAEPPPGFETRVLARIGAAAGPVGSAPGPRGRDGRRTRGPVAPHRRRRVAAALALTAAASMIGFVAGRATGPAADDGGGGGGRGGGGAELAAPMGSAPAQLAALVTAKGTQVGVVTVIGGAHAYALFDVEDWPDPDARYSCELVLRDGSIVHVGTWSAGGAHTWAVDTPSGLPVSGARMRNGDRVWATAEFG